MVESQGGRLDRMTAQQRAEMAKLRGWTTASYGMFAEYNVTKMLERVFSSEPCCLVNSFVENQLVNIAKEALDPEVKNIKQKYYFHIQSRLCGVFSVSRILRRSRRRSSLGWETSRQWRE